MILDATSVGELVKSIAPSGTKGRAKRLFRNSAYLESKAGLILLLRGRLRSPMTINVLDGPDFSGALAPDEEFESDSSGIHLGEITIGLDGAEVYRSALLKKRSITSISAGEIAKGATALKLLYSASEASLSLVNGQAFNAFADTVLRPLAAGRTSPVHRFANYAGLIGSGIGFTPAGDDFVAGFAAAFNYRVRGTRERQILLPLKSLRRRTVAESASLVAYAQKGYVDEGLQNLILAGFGGKPALFREHLSELASRGHTSGLDMSLGVLMLLACVADQRGNGQSLESSLEVLLD